MKPDEAVLRVPLHRVQGPQQLLGRWRGGPAVRRMEPIEHVLLRQAQMGLQVLGAQRLVAAEGRARAARRAHAEHTYEHELAHILQTRDLDRREQ